MSTAQTRPNAAEIGNWNDAMGRTWVTLHERLDRQLAPIGHAAMAKAGFAAGQVVLDVGCGCGETTLELAGRIAPGEVLGVDVSTMLLDVARDTAKAQGVGNIRFLQADAQVHAFAAASFDVLFSRFGVMFFEDPKAAFANMRPALKSDGRLAFCCWRPPQENLMLSLAMQATHHLLPAMPPADPYAPGPFAFADHQRTRSILEGAGFADVQIEPFDQRAGEESLEDSVFSSLRIGQLGTALRQIGPTDELKRTLEVALRAALEPYVVDGVVKLPAAAWIVSARNA